MAAPKRIGFFCELSPQCINEIRRKAKASGVPQWQVIATALFPNDKPAKKSVAKAEKK